MIQVSFLRTEGAGGFALSQNLAVYPVVDVDIAPAFRILDVLRYAKYCHCSAEVTTRLVELASLRIARLYQDKKASPLDLSVHGSSLINDFISVSKYPN